MGDAFEQIQSYVEAAWNARAPANYVIPDGLKVGAWLATQRRKPIPNLLSQIGGNA